MKDVIKSFKWTMILFGMITAIIGVVLVIYPKSTAKAICIAIGCILLLAGAISLIVYMKNRREKISSPVMLGLGIVQLAVGVFILFNIGMFIDFLATVFAIILIVHGLNDLAQGFHIRSMGYEDWKRALVVALVTIILGVVVLFEPFGSTSALMMLAGIALIIDGITEIYLGLKVSRYNSKYQDKTDFKDAVKAEYDEVKSEAENQQKALDDEKAATEQSASDDKKEEQGEIKG